MAFPLKSQSVNRNEVRRQKRKGREGGRTPLLGAMGVQTANSQSRSDSFKGILCMRQIQPLCFAFIYIEKINKEHLGERDRARILKESRKEKKVNT